MLLEEDPVAERHGCRKTLLLKDTAAERHCCRKTLLLKDTAAERHGCRKTLLQKDTAAERHCTRKKDGAGKKELQQAGNYLSLKKSISPRRVATASKTMEESQASGVVGGSGSSTEGSLPVFRPGT
ncbi:hypothetical protein EYF80_027315 [Liparis tanakae]|uniref:Uncharacterized protein n=1 Tax=Liparis tanakae TaxID=230148 RepID=A0A4Z2HCL4_9TELE|nr:hypothetical protein EYF80_027315 [Liparis tanakae]